MPDGERKVVDVTHGRPSITLVVVNGVLNGAVFPELTSAESALINALQEGKLVCLGLENNRGDPQEIPRIAWADLKFFHEPDIAGPADYFRIGATMWHSLKFSRAAVLRLWPSQEEKTTQQPIQTGEANKTRARSKAVRKERIRELVGDIYREAKSRNMSWTARAEIERPLLPYSKEEFYDAFYRKYSDAKKVKCSTFYDDLPQIVKFTPGRKPNQMNRICDLLKLN